MNPEISGVTEIISLDLLGKLLTSGVRTGNI